MANSKGESDKDLLFSKILPALNNNAFANRTDETETPDIAPPQAETGDLLSALRSRLFARSADYHADSFVTINVMENLVLEHIDAALKRFNACTCDRCRCDVAAYALNRLPPRYVVAGSKTMEAAFTEAEVKQVMDALVTAVLHFRSHPQH